MRRQPVPPELVHVDDHPTEEVSRLRARIRKGPPLDRVAAWTRRRNHTLWLRGHPSALPRLVAAPEALPAGASASGHDIIKVGRIETYLPASGAAQVARDLSLREVDAQSANAVIKVPPEVWPFDQEPGPVAVAIDLWETGDERSRRSARTLYQQALATHAPNTRAS